jgi:predicted unusual protein kinase regulating ubiquinone biosynthesis (AarF/ABC1/UbiB family)
MQDRVPAFSPEKAKAFIEKEMGCSIDVVYKEFEERPIAAASLGQVFNRKLCLHLHFLPNTFAYLQQQQQ